MSVWVCVCVLIVAWGQLYLIRTEAKSKSKNNKGNNLTSNQTTEPNKAPLNQVTDGGGGGQRRFC